MSILLLTEHHLVFLSLKGGCTVSSEFTLVKMPHCWKSHATAQISKSINIRKLELNFYKTNYAIIYYKIIVLH